MIGFLSLVTVVGTALMLLLIMAAVLRKFPVHLMYKVNAVISGVCLAAVLAGGDALRSTIQLSAFAVWTAAAIVYHRNARRQARQAAGGQTP